LHGFIVLREQPLTAEHDNEGSLQRAWRQVRMPRTLPAVLAKNIKLAIDSHRPSYWRARPACLHPGALCGSTRLQMIGAAAAEADHPPRGLPLRDFSRDRDHGAFYPSLRQFRQSTPRDWPGAIERAQVALRQLAAGDRGQLRLCRSL
jgi:hypothetical protein